MLKSIVVDMPASFEILVKRKEMIESADFKKKKRMEIFTLFSILITLAAGFLI